MFITFEGGEGSGKSTAIERLALELQKRNLPIVITREPGGSKLSEVIRQWLLSNETDAAVGDRAELLLFLAARAQHVEELIKPAINDGKIVLCDRFNDSSIAYQGHARGFGAEEVETLCSFACDNIWPELTFFFDIDPKIGLARLDGNDRIESEDIDFHNTVREGFLAQAKKYPERYCIIDATQTKDGVYNDVLTAFEQKYS
ncbi:MAG: dTMP kinase [Waddliaceae bacterium]|jgi:dTMP kinase|nr:dTMP kinase [Waddliaceae bacterium]MBT3578399.1 dTMP kinase [Waddliaceae bacterium]MBT4445285.1 dTMP kinase [Waddliaceae bacterium]MBT6928556.1 dTMP kinase [Waddliaceae bacterium]MBT7264563.1 dTMP kinase [Waddliaceae bacterium]